MDSRHARIWLWVQITVAAVLLGQELWFGQLSLRDPLVIVAGIIMVAVSERWSLRFEHAQISLASAATAAVFVATGLPAAISSLILGNLVIMRSRFKGVKSFADIAMATIVLVVASSVYHVWHGPFPLGIYILTSIIMNLILASTFVLMRNGRLPSTLLADFWWELIGWAFSVPLIAIYSLIVRQDLGWRRMLAVLPFLTVVALLYNWQTVRKAHQQTLVVADISTRMAQAQSVAALLDFAEIAVARTIGYTLLVVYLRAPSGMLERTKVWHPMGDDAPFERFLVAGEGITGWAVESRSPILIQDSSKDPNVRYHPKDLFPPRSACILPLVIGKSLEGIVVIGHYLPKQYGSHDFDIAKVIASHVAVAVHQLRVSEISEQRAVSDPMIPKIANYRHFTEVASTLMTHEGESFAVIFLDVDHFKKINDRYGHQMGDRILTDVAHVIRAQMRPDDLLARYGGDEFICLLRDVSPEGIGPAATRIQQAVSNHPWELEWPIGISVGYATYPSQATSLDELIDVADRRMYRNKMLRKQADAEPVSDTLS